MYMFSIFRFRLGWFAHRIFNEEGDYPSIITMWEQVDSNSAEQGYNRSTSRLPKFTPEEVEGSGVGRNVKTGDDVLQMKGQTFYQVHLP